MENKKIKPYIYVVLAVAIVIVIVFWRAGSSKEVSADVANLAACLASKNITMYGADWCPHCQNEKRAFGDAFKQIPYVECPDNPQKCLDMGIKGYPTWVWPDGYSPTGSPVKGKRLEGEQGIDKLTEESGCKSGQP